MSCLESAWGGIKGSGETKGLLFHQALVREDREGSQLEIEGMTEKSQREVLEIISIVCQVGLLLSSGNV